MPLGGSPQEKVPQRLDRLEARVLRLARLDLLQRAYGDAGQFGYPSEPRRGHVGKPLLD